MKFDVEPSPEYIEHVSKVDSDINKQLPSNILKLDDGDRNMEDIMLDSAEVKGLQSIDVSQPRNEFKSCNLSDNINNQKSESGRRNFPCLRATSEIDLIAQEDLYMDKAVTDVKDICIDEGMQAFENVSIEYDKVSDEEISANLNIRTVKGSSILLDETPERENPEDSNPSSSTEGLRSLGEVLQRNNGDIEIAGPSRQLDTTERIACTLPSEEIIELRSHSFEEFKYDFPRADSCSRDGSTAESQDLRQKNDQVSEEEKDESTSIVGNKNKILNNQLSFQSQNDDVGTEEVMGSGDGTTSARTSFTRLVHGNSDLLGPSYLHGPIATSTHIPYSGSISFKSESSTTSTHSFAFPKLQAEWTSSSPVRMAQAKRRRLRKLRRWKSKLLCCKF